MKAVSVLLLFFLGIGVLVRSYNRWVRMLLAIGIAVVLLYLYLS